MGDATTRSFEDRLRDRLVQLDADTERPGTVMPARRWRRRSVAVVTGAALLVAAGGAAATGFALRQDRPTTAEAGGSLDVKGAGCAPGVRVVVLLDGAQATSTAATSDGLFSLSLPVSRAEPLGRHEVTTRCAGPSGGAVEDTFAIEVVAPGPPEPVVGAPPDARAGEPLGVKGAGFPASTQVALAWDGVRLATTRTNEDGTFFVQVPVPVRAERGMHTVTARAGAVDATTSVVVQAS